jgi:hypothetical protein
MNDEEVAERIKEVMIKIYPDKDERLMTPQSIKFHRWLTDPNFCGSYIFFNTI